MIIFNISEPEDLEPGAREENDRTFCENMFVEKLNVDNVKIKKVNQDWKKERKFRKAQATNSAAGTGS